MSKADKKPDKEFVFLPLGGTGEIGMNCNLYGFGPSKAREWLMIDLGISFGDERYPGIDVMMPDIGYIEKQKDRLHAIILTHGHEDHIGAIAHLWPYLRCPIYATPFTLTLVQEKFRNKSIDAGDKLHVVEPDKPLQLGAFRLEFMGLTHSIPEMQAIAIHTSLGRVLHTGDWKLDPKPGVGAPSDIAALKRFGNQGVQAMICDSTNALEEGHSGSEAEVHESLTKLVAQYDDRRLFISGFASNVARLQTIGQVAHASGRGLAMLGRGMWRIYNAARANGYLEDFPTILSEKDAASYPSHKLLVLCTGSQGEPLAALNRLAQDRFEHLRFGQTDTVIFSSRIIPGNQIAVLSLHNRLIDRGVQVIIADAANRLHVSGHPCRDELRQLYAWVRPQLAVPVHGEARHIEAHCALALDAGVPEAQTIRNGSMLRLAPGPAHYIAQVQNGRLHLDGKVLVHATESPAHARAALAQEGLVSVFVAQDTKGRRATSPVVKLTGLARYDTTGAPLQTVIHGLVEDLLGDGRNIAKRRASLERALQRAIYTHCGKRPMIEFLIQSL